MESLELDRMLSLYRNKRVLITGHTGFKGSWLAVWLLQLGADVIGLALEPKTEKDNFVLTKLSSKIKDYRIDIRNKHDLFGVFNKEKPNIVFHLAAQPLVLESYDDPLTTFETNTQGTANVLEAIRQTDSVEIGIFITTDKVYENKEWIWPYREDEPLGGYDPYSASKGAAELIISSYRNSFFNPDNYQKHTKAIASVRAGNVIGGGDWSDNRLVPDCIKSLGNNETIIIRNPKAVRPWQHVLEPLGGYLLLGAKMLENPVRYSQAWNFGPEPENIVTVETMVNKLIKEYGSGKWIDKSGNNAPHEANLLALDINKAKYELGWRPVLNLDETINYTVDWYKRYKSESVMELCVEQIEAYANKWRNNYTV